MKLSFKVGKLVEHSTKSMLVAYRAGDQIQLQTLEFHPENRFEVKNEGGFLTIKVLLNDGDFLALDQEQGMAEKKTI